MKLIPQGGCWINLPKPIQKTYMGASYKSGGGKRGMARRLSLKEPSLTLMTSPSQKMTERCHPTETRPLTNREYARIQTFPDSFQFSGSTNNIYKQIGNAVPCLLSFYIGIQIMICLNKIEKETLRTDLARYLLVHMENKKILKKKVVQFIVNKKIKQLYEKKINVKNIDKVKSALDKKMLSITDKEWTTQLKLISKDKSILNKIGELHEYVLSNCKGWMSCSNSEKYKDLGADIMKKNKTAFLEIKNRYNTMNSKSKKETINRLKKIKKKYPDAFVAIGVINEKDSYPDGRKYKIENDIYYISGKKLFRYVYKCSSYLNDIINAIDKIK